MKLILIDEVPENPYPFPKTLAQKNYAFGWDQGQQSILSKAIPIEEIDKIWARHSDYLIAQPTVTGLNRNIIVKPMSFSQYLQQQIENEKD